MTPEDGPILVGNNLAVVIAAHELAKHGRAVTLLTDSRPLGGHFAGITIDGDNFDMGMVLLEQHAPACPGADLRDFGPHIRNDWTRFGDRGSAWLEAQGALVRTPTPQALHDNEIVPDYLIANRLDAFANAPVSSPPTLDRDDARHAANKALPGCYDSLSYGEAARLNHGSELHARFIEPYARKVLGVSSNDFLARYHRAGWLPLYHPGTLSAALRGEPVGLPEYPFYTTACGFVGAIVRQIEARLGAMPNVAVVNEPVVSLARREQSWEVGTAGRLWRSADLVLGLPPERCHALLGLGPLAPAQAASVTVFFTRVRAGAIKRPLGCLMVVDDDYASYRVCDQDALAGLTPEWRRVVVEASPERLAGRYPGLTPEAALQSELCNLMQLDAKDAIEPLRCITARNALPLPTPEGIAAAMLAHETVVTALPDARLTGSLLGYGVASFNDQLIQALKIAQELA
ncbi:MAG TPA: FAD/NAD(P)-binding protein [Burkholderiales bacterium]|nr:FAD/NAD(P)-binding protein [Burkholderiales bacterium]